MRTTSFIALLVLCSIFMGCASRDPIKMWQARIEDYVQNEGNGSLSAIRSLSAKSTHQQFGVLGRERGAFGPTRTDVISVVVGNRRIDDQSWFLFLLGVVEYQGGAVDVTFDHPHVLDIRVAGLCREQGAYRWAISEESGEQLAKYIAAQQTDWRRSHPSRENETIPNTQFPTIKDWYDLTGDQRTVTIREVRSGASWTLQLPE